MPLRGSQPWSESSCLVVAMRRDTLSIVSSPVRSILSFQSMRRRRREPHLRLNLRLLRDSRYSMTPTLSKESIIRIWHPSQLPILSPRPPTYSALIVKMHPRMTDFPLACMTFTPSVKQAPFIAFSVDREAVGIVVAAAFFAGPEEADFAGVVAFPLIEAAGGKVEEDVDDGVFAGFLTHEAGVWRWSQVGKQDMIRRYVRRKGYGR